MKFSMFNEMALWVYSEKINENSAVVCFVKQRSLSKRKLEKRKKLVNKLLY